MALITNQIDSTSEFVSLSQCKAFINAGGAIVPHSPSSPNITTQFPNDPQGAANAMLECINYIKSKGLDVPRFDKCFVYSQGRYQDSLFDTKYIEAMRGIGIDIARISWMQGIRHQRNLDAHSRLGRLACTNIGHEYAGTDAAENTNIADVIQRINDCALYGLDCFLMLHTVKKAGQQQTRYDISVPNLRLLGNAIKAQVDAGKMECVTMPELVIDGDNYWNQF